MGNFVGLHLIPHARASTTFDGIITSLVVSRGYLHYDSPHLALPHPTGKWKLLEAPRACCGRTCIAHGIACKPPSHRHKVPHVAASRMHVVFAYVEKLIRGLLLEGTTAVLYYTVAR